MAALGRKRPRYQKSQWNVSIQEKALNDADYLKDYSNSEALQLLDLLRSGQKLLSPHIKRLIKEIEAQSSASDKHKRKNLEGIQAIDSCRIFWRNQVGKEAPRLGLNIATKFGRFVCDVFEILEIEGTPVAAFNAWVRETKS